MMTVFEKWMLISFAVTTKSDIKHSKISTFEISLLLASKTRNIFNKSAAQLLLFSLSQLF